LAGLSGKIVAMTVHSSTSDILSVLCTFRATLPDTYPDTYPYVSSDEETDFTYRTMLMRRELERSYFGQKARQAGTVVFESGIWIYAKSLLSQSIIIPFSRLNKTIERDCLEGGLHMPPAEVGALGVTNMKGIFGILIGGVVLTVVTSMGEVVRNKLFPKPVGGCKSSRIRKFPYRVVRRYR
jgi:hypothetical protein